MKKVNFKKTNKINNLPETAATPEELNQFMEWVADQIYMDIETNLDNMIEEMAKSEENDLLFINKNK